MAWQESIGRAFGSFARGVDMAWQRTACAVANLRRRLLRNRLPDYVVLTLDGPLSERAPDVPWWYTWLPLYEEALSLEELAKSLRRIAGDPDVKGVVFLLHEPSFSLTQAQSLAQLFARFREWDAQHTAPDASPKQIAVYLQQASIPAYVAACAADRIVLAPLATWDVVGLRAAPLFLKETLAHLGIEFDVVRVAPWKTAADQVSQAEMSEAHREQLAWLLDSLYDDIVSAIAQGRGLNPAQVKALIDAAPLTADHARDGGLVDDLAYEDELPQLLGEAEEPARLKLFDRVERLLLRRPQAHPALQIGVLSLEGAIMPGESRSSPIPLPIFGDTLMGSETVAQMARAARKNPSLAAVVVHVDSGGGSALASDAIWRELKLLDEEKPVIVYMGNVAASGGYYIAAPGRKIVAQNATLTGSIGVITAKAITRGALEKLHARRASVQRGANADIYADDAAWNDAQRQLMDDQIQYIYRRFKTVVAHGRKLDYDDLDEICSGKVWTGKQALGNGLVDAVGDFQVALDFACVAAGLPTDGSVYTTAISAPRRHLLAEPLEAAQGALGVTQRGTLRQIIAAVATGEWEALFGHEHCWLIADGLPRIPRI